MWASAVQAGSFADAVVSFSPGRNAGFGQDQLPGIVLGPPKGGGALQGSLDVLSLGHGGEIVLRLDPPVICDGPGADLIVFENAFHAGGPTGPVFAELGIVAVSQDGQEFRTFPYDRASWQGLAGKSPVFSNPENGMDPRDPLMAGGDAFDLAEVGLPWAAFVRIRDAGDEMDDPGNRVPASNSAGFDLDAIAAVHVCVPGVPVPTASLTPSTTVPPTPTQTATASATPTYTAAATHTATATSSPSPTPTPAASPAQCRRIEDTLAALFHEATPAADHNGDGRISAADLVFAVEALPCHP